MFKLINLYAYTNINFDLYLPDSINDVAYGLTLFEICILQSEGLYLNNKYITYILNHAINLKYS